MREEFNILDVAGVYSGFLLKEDGMSSLQQALQRMTGCQLWTHQLPEAARNIRHHIADQLPELAALSFESVTPETVDVFRADLVTKFGEAVMLDVPMLEGVAADPFSGLPGKFQ